MRYLSACLMIILLVSSCAWFRTAPKEKIPEETTKEELRAEEEMLLAKAENYVSDGINYYQAGNDSLAVKSWRKALDIIPDDAEVHNFIGISLHRSGQIEKAYMEFSAAVKINQGYYQAYNNAGYMLFLQKKYGDALSAFNKSLKINPSYKPALKNLRLMDNIVYANLSRDAFEIAEEVSKEYDYAEQIKGYGKVLELDSTFAKAHNNIAVAYFYEGFLDSAYYHLAKAIKLKKNYPEAINNLGYLYKMDEKYEIAIKLFLKALALKPRYIGALNNLGETFALYGDNENARMVYQTVLELEPHNEVAKTALSEFGASKTPE